MQDLNVNSFHLENELRKRKGSTPFDILQQSYGSFPKLELTQKEIKRLKYAPIMENNVFISKDGNFFVNKIIITSITSIKRLIDRRKNRLQNHSP